MANHGLELLLLIAVAVIITKTLMIIVDVSNRVSHSNRPLAQRFPKILNFLCSNWFSELTHTESIPEIRV